MGVDVSPWHPPIQHVVASQVERRDRGGLRRIRDNRFAELAYRGWHEASAWLERIALVDSPLLPAGAVLRAHAPALADGEAAARALRDAAQTRFFHAVGPDAVRLYAERFPGDRDALLAAAASIRAGHIPLPGFDGDARRAPGPLFFGTPIDWHFDPVRNHRLPSAPWRTLDARDPAVGDCRLVWELNRHQWLVRLAQAHAVTGDPSYAEACASALASWRDANAPGAGINWVSSAEVSYRLVSWCWLLMLLRDAPPFAAADSAARDHLLAGIWTHATHVRRCLSHRCSPNNGLTAEALGLFYAGVLFPEFRDAAHWCDDAARILVADALTQVHDDGVHFEQSTGCQRYTLELYLHFLLLAERTGVIVPPAVTTRVQRMVEALMALRRPDGSIPAIGDDDGGWVLPLTPRAPADAQGLFAVAAALFGRADFAWAAGSVTPEVAWLMGRDGVERFERLDPAPPATAASRVLPSGGYAVMRSGWGPQDHQMIVDVGPLGCPIGGGHGHADLLALQCSIFGEPCLVDAGTSESIAEPQWREYFRSTAAHSTVVVDGVSQAEPAGPFGWRRQPRARLRAWHSTPEFDFLDAEHDGYLTLPDPVLHRRRVIFVKPFYWIVVDDLAGAARHQVDLTFQFAAMEVELAAHPWARARTTAGPVLWVSAFPSAPVHPSVINGQRSPISGWIAQDYARREAAPKLIYRFAVALPWRIVTLLLPDSHGLQTPPVVRAIYDDAGVPVGIAFERPRRVVRFDDRLIQVER